MIPLRDDQPCKSFAFVNYSIIAVNLAVFGYEMSVRARGYPAWRDMLMRYGTVPHHFELAFTGSSQYTISGAFLSILTAMFMHASILHIIGNMWVLWIFGDNIEDHLGHIEYLLFYLLCGFLASMVHIYANPNLDIPAVGASGAIAGVMGAFLLRYPLARVQMLVIFSLLAANVVWMPAWGMLGFWFFFQFIGVILAQVLQPHVPHTTGGGVAYWTHVGGFLIGMVLIKIIPGPAQYAHGGWLAKDGKEILPKQ